MPDVNKGIINYGSIGGSATVSSDTVHIGDKLAISDVHNANLTLKSKLDHVYQAIDAAPFDKAIKGELSDLIHQLSAELTGLSSEMDNVATSVATAVKETMEKAAKMPPDKESIKVSAKGLIEAAKSIADVLPIAIKIASTIALAFRIAI